MNPRLSLGQSQTQPRIILPERLDIEGCHGPAVGPEDAVFDVIQRVDVPAKAVSDGRKELVSEGVKKKNSS